MNRFKLHIVTSLLAIACSLTGVGYAQSVNGTVAGTVLDSSGAAVPGAKVTVTSIATNDKRTVTTGPVGNYRVDGELPGYYRVEVVAPSFNKTSVDRALVNASVITSVNVTLTPGSASTSVEVNGETQALKTDSGELSETLQGVEVNTLPIQSLNPYELATTLPGVTTVTAADFTNGTSFSGNGGRPRSNNFLIEGVDNNDQGIHGQAFQPENDEAISEVTFLLNSFSAEYGRGGLVSNMAFVSGSNQFHGAVYERIMNSSLDATDKGDIVNGLTKAASRENIFGFRIGGPIIKDRLFFFFSNQWDRYRTTAHGDVLLLPTQSGYDQLNNYNSNPRIATLIQTYGGLVGVNSIYDTTVNLGQGRGVVDYAGYQRVIGAPQNSRELEATADYIVSSKDKFRFRFVQAPDSLPIDLGNFPDQLPGFDTGQSGVTYDAGITETHIFNQNVMNELRLSWSRIGFDFVLTPETLANPLSVLPAVGISGATGYGIPAGSVPQGRFQNTYQIQDALSISKGRNTIKFGFDLLDMRIKDNIPFNYYGSINYGSAGGANSGLSNYMDDYSGTSTAATASIAFGNPTARPEIWSQNYFVQDSIKVLPNLVVDAGLRYEYSGTPFNYLGYPAIDPANPAPFPASIKQVGDKNDIAPRLGFNYSPTANGKTVISGGFGVFYDHIFTNIIDNIQGSAPNAASKIIYGATSGRGTANWSTALNVCATCAITTTAAEPTDAANVIASHFIDPVTYQYNLRIQQQLPAGIVASVAYVGNRGLKLYTTDEWNPTYLPDLTQFATERVFPTRQRIILQDNQGDSNYNSLQLELQQKPHHGASFRAAYTYGKNLDDGSEIFTDSGPNGSTYAEIDRAPRGREYGPSLFDHTHRVVVSGVYEIPIWHAQGGMKIASAIVNGFVLSGVTSFQTGNPINAEIGYDWNADGITNDRPLLSNKKAPIDTWALSGSDYNVLSFGQQNVPIADGGAPLAAYCDGPEFWYTADSCKQVDPTTVHWLTSQFGTTGNTLSRNALRADHTSNTDIGIQRNFHIWKSQTFEFRAEAFNVFNQGNTGNYNATLTTGVPFNGTDEGGNVYTGSPTFGLKYPTVTGSRILRFFARYEF